MKIRTAKITETTRGFCDIIDIIGQITARDPHGKHRPRSPHAVRQRLDGRADDH